MTIDTAGRTHDRRDDFAEVYGDWDEVAERTRPRAPVTGSGPAGSDRPRPGARPGRDRAGAGAPAVLSGGEVADALRQAERAPARLTDAQAIALLGADGPDLEALAGIADGLRRDVKGDDVTYVVTRNINFTNVCYTGCRFCAFAQRRTDADAYTLSLEQIGDRAEEAWAAGATEVCMQGGIHPDLPGTAYFEIAAEVKRRCPDLHVHAFSPDGGGQRGLPHRPAHPGVAGPGQGGRLGSLPGTAAEILDDDVRWVLTKGKLPASVWIEVITTAHELGLPTSSTMMYGHVDTPAHWVGAPAGHPLGSRSGPAASPSSCCCRSSTRTRRSTWPAWPGPGRRGGRTGPCTPCPGCCCTGDRLHPVLVGQARRGAVPRRAAAAASTTWAAR